LRRNDLPLLHFFGGEGRGEEAIPNARRLRRDQTKEEKGLCCASRAGQFVGPNFAVQPEKTSSPNFSSRGGEVTIAVRAKRSATPFDKRVLQLGTSLAVFGLA
jgi:hypothetical protein